MAASRPVGHFSLDFVLTFRVEPSSVAILLTSSAGAIAVAIRGPFGHTVAPADRFCFPWARRPHCLRCPVIFACLAAAFETINHAVPRPFGRSACSLRRISWRLRWRRALGSVKPVGLSGSRCALVTVAAWCFRVSWAYLLFRAFCAFLGFVLDQ